MSILRSGCRALAAHPRNLTDDQLRAIARTGGVVGINFYPVFLDDHFRHQYVELRGRLRPQLDSIRWGWITLGWEVTSTASVSCRVP